MQNPPHKKAKYLDHNYWRIPATVARTLSGGRLPRHGKEKAALYQGKSYWIARTVHKGKQIWTMREAAIPFQERNPPADILATEKRNGQTYSYIILPEKMDDPKRDGWRVHMNLNDGSFDTAGQGWHLSRDRALERLGINLAGQSYYEKVDVTIYSSEVDRYFKEERIRLETKDKEEKLRQVREEGERRSYQERAEEFRGGPKKHKWRKTQNFRIAIRGGDTTVPAWTIEGSGLGIHRELGYASGKPGKGYGITHERSGFKVAADFPSLETAKIAVVRLINQFDWNIDKKEILKTKTERGEFVRKIQKDVFANPPRRKTKFHPPYTVDVWEERDRLSIVVTDRDDKDVAEWWDDDARQMFEDGFFESGRNLESSVIKYLQDMDVIGSAYPNNPPQNIGDESGQTGGVHVDIYQGNPLEARDSGTFKRGAYHQYYIVYSDGRMIHSKDRYGTIVQAGKALAERLKIPYDYDKNPPPEYKIPAEIYRNIIEIRAKKKDGKLYRHPFGPSAGIYGLSDGSILIKSRRGKRLWKNFPKGRK